MKRHVIILTLVAGVLANAMLSACHSSNNENTETGGKITIAQVDTEKTGAESLNNIADVRLPDVKIHVKRGQPLIMQTKGLTLTAYDVAVQHEADYSVTSLVGEELPPLPQGMMNMTAATAGYRLLPGGEHFLPYAELRMTYDPERLPEGYTPDDIYTSYYDTATLAWVRLERVEVDTVNHEIVSLTTHFTDFINELLKAPEMPETQAFVPTAMSDLEAVSPMDGLTMIQPPTANNNGTANVSYPLLIPAGRNGMQPNLALNYNSANGSGWLGVGWDIPVPSITLDTRWGVPRYNATYETEIYLLDGEQLITKEADGTPRLMPHRTNQQTYRDSLGDPVQFYARFGDAHDSIIRHGDSPKNYWWEVIDRNGTTHYYGRYHQSDRSMDIHTEYNILPGLLPTGVTFNAINNNLHWPLPTTLCDDSGNIAQWVLTESRDLYGNTVRYYYDQATVKNRGAEGRQIYLDSISYTGHNDTDGYYTIVFCRTGNNTPDVPETCNKGFKEITDQLLNNIYLKCGDSIQTIWHFEIENSYSSNFKNRLTSVTKIDSVGNMHMRGLLNSFCHCIRQDEDEFGTAPSILMPDHQELRLVPVRVLEIDTLIGIEQIETFITDYYNSHFFNINGNIYRAAFRSSVYNAAYDSIFPDENKKKVYINKHYETQMDSVWVTVFDSISWQYRPLSDTLKYAGVTTNFVYYNSPNSMSLFGRKDTMYLTSSDENLRGFLLSDYVNPLGQLLDLPLGRATALGLSTSSSWNVGGTAALGTGPVVCLTSASVGGNYSRSGSSSETLMALVDLNGDGLSDKVYVKDEKMYFCPQRWNDSLSFYFDNPIEVRGIHHIMKSNSTSNTFGVQASLVASASASWTDSKSTTSTYFTDVNGDGLVDLVDEGQIYFNHLDEGREPVFMRYSAVPIEPAEEEVAVVASLDTACRDIIFDGAASDSINCQRVWVLIDTFTASLLDEDLYIWLNEHLEDTMYRMTEDQELLKVEMYHREWDCSYHDDSPNNDAVRVWIAPRQGDINITTRIYLIEDSTSSRRVSRHADGVVLSVQKTTDITHGHSRFNAGSTNIPLLNLVIDSTDYSMHVDSNRIVPVDSGDMIFFRLRSKNDHNFDNAYTRFTIDYNGGDREHFDSHEDFVLSSNGYLQAPVDGYYKIAIHQLTDTGNVSVTLMVNDRTECLRLTDDSLYKKIHVQQYDSIRVVLRSNNDTIKWGDVECKAHITFVPDPGSIIYDTTYSGGPVVDTLVDTLSLTEKVEGWFVPQVELHDTCIIYTTPLYRRLFGPLHKGWGQFAYRSEGDDTELIQLEKLIPPDMMVPGNSESADSTEIDNKTKTSIDTTSLRLSESIVELQNSNTNLYTPYSHNSNWIEMTPDAQHWAWVGYGHQNTVRRDMMSNSIQIEWYSSTPNEEEYNPANSTEQVVTIPQSTIHDDPVPPAYQGTPAKAVNKVNRSKSHSWSAGFHGAGDSFSMGDNTIETEYMDLNGDRYPDIVGTDMIQYSRQWGGVGPVTELSSSLSHGSASHTWSDGKNYSASPVIQERTGCSFQQNALFTMHSKGSGNVSVGGNIGYDKSGGSWVDINGDGLPDFVYPNGKVRLNIGYDFVDDKEWDFTNVRNGVSGAISEGVGIQGGQEEMETDLLRGVTNIYQASIEAGVGIDGSYNQTTHMLMDINGDGLPDKLWRELNNVPDIISGERIVDTKVRYNLGAGKFSEEYTLDIGRFHSSATFSESMNVGITYGFTVWGLFKITAGVNGCPYSGGVTQDYVQLADVNADGLPDWVYSIKENEMVVRYNQGGRTNLLKSVTNFNNADFKIEYELSDADYNQPSRSWLMTKVTTHDALNSHNGATTTMTKYTYKYPHYDRYERTSYGYGTVVTSDMNPATENVYRTVERNYYNNNMLRRGQIRREITRDAGGNPYIERLHQCTYVDYTHGDTVNVDTQCPKISYPKMEITLTNFYEGDMTPQLTTGEMFEYDRYHNVTKYIDMGDTADHEDGLVVEFQYYEGLQHNLIGLRKRYAVIPTGSADTLRKARFEYDVAHGMPTRQVLYNGADSAVYDFVYESTFGNLQTAMQPKNINDERMTYSYTYDNVVHTYPTEIVNSHGETMNSTYDYRYGKPLSVTDPTGSTMAYRYDFAGRLVSVNSPLNTSGTPSVVNEYHPVNYYHNGLNPQGYTFNNSPTNHPYSLSKHYDDNGSLITATAVLTNGYGQAIQTKKGLRVGSDDKMQVSGRVVVDAFGRTISQYDPFTVADTSLNTLGRFESYRDSSATVTTYDVLDRTTSTVRPLGVTTHASYSIGDDQGEHHCFVTTMTDPNGNVTTQYADYEGRKVQVTDANGEITLMHYDNLGQLASATDPEGFTTTYEYDMLGRMTKRIHPDAGETRYTYDNAGNLLEEQNPLGQIFYDYTYYRVLNKRYSNMTGNNVTYTYGTSGTSKGRPIHISDGTGSHELTYDALGNVTAETRIIVLPNSQEEFSLTMKYKYDSWGRMLSMTYPDSEKVNYTYQWGGELNAMQSTMRGNVRTYIGQIQYNDYGQRSHVTYGNSTSAEYSYDSLHRLTNLKCRDGSNTLMQDIDYTYDNASNVTEIANSAGAVNTLGGGYVNTYQYDALHRLVGSTGGGAGTGTYNMTMNYTGSGRVESKYSSSQSPTLSGTVRMFYGYCDEYQPHAVRHIYDKFGKKHYDFRWDEAGNLGQVSYCNRYGVFESGRFLYWTEDSRMHVAVDDNHYSYYAYDYSGERRIKLTGDNSVLDVNAEFMSTVSTLENVTLYPSSYMVLTDRGYTKHYYTGMERVAARIGDGGLDVGIHLMNTDSLHARANRLFDQSLEQANHRVLEANDLDCIMSGGQYLGDNGIFVEEIPERMLTDVMTEYGEFIGAMHQASNDGGKSDVYYYHGDHLGSASWITDASGAAVQHLQYLPFGERFVDQRTSGYSERFTFTGKERDEETGYGYFGARYMDYELMTMWLSVDPMSDKYPSISPYAYCAWNPVKLVDPDGNEFFITGGDGVKYYLTISKDRSLRWVSRDGQSYNIEDNPWVSKLTTAITTLMEKSKTAENVITTLAKDPDHECELREGFRNEIDPSGKGEWIKWTGEVSRGNTLYLSEDGEWFYKPTEKNSPAYIGLIHEMAHAADAWYGYTKDPNGVWEVFQPQNSDNAKNILNMEKYAVWVENRVRHEMGLPRRLYYYFNVKTNVGAGCIGGINFNDTL